MINGIPRRVWSTVAICRPLDAAYHTIEHHGGTADVSLLDRVHPGVGVRVALAVRLTGEVDRHLETLAIGGDPGNLFADVLSHIVVGQLWETALASSCHPVWGPATANATTTDAVGVQHVGEGLGGVGLDVTSQSATSSEAKSPCDARQAEKQDQLESHLWTQRCQRSEIWLLIIHGHSRWYLYSCCLSYSCVLTTWPSTFWHWQKYLQSWKMWLSVKT